MTKQIDDAVVGFVAAYDGPALADHSIPVRDLAPALLALGQSFDRANDILNGERAAVSLEIRATSQGSFEIALLLKQIYEGAGTVFPGADFVSTAADLKELVIGGSGILGLVGLIKWAKGKRPTSVASDAQDAVILEIEHLRLTVPSNLVKLFNDSILRDQIEAVVRPLVKQGIETLTFKENNVEIEKIEKVDVPSFEQGGGQSGVITETVIPRQRLRPVNTAFNKNGKWRLTDGEKARWYSITDKEFISQVQDGTRRFGARDLITAEVVLIQDVQPNGDLSLSYEITKVLSHTVPPMQGSMLDEDAAPGSL